MYRQTGQSAPVKRNKYGNTKTRVDGLLFDSKKEAARYGVLKLRQQAGEIENLRLQVPYLLHVNGQSVGKFYADFAYIEKGTTVVQDVKSIATKTSVYNLKKRLMKAVYGIDVKEV